MKPHYILTLSSALIASSFVLAAEPSKIEITVSVAGVVTFAGGTVTMEQLAERLTKAVRKEKKPDLLIIASENAPPKVLAAVMDLCRKSGFKKFSIQNA